jgi:triacylglycerol lipase
MMPSFDALAVFIGGRYAPDTLNLTTDWQPNDGVVNTFSMSHDGVGELVAFSGTSAVGKWMQMEQLRGLDHMDITGFSLFTEVTGVYSSLAKLLASLPVDAEARSSTFSEDVHASVSSSVSSLVSARASIQTTADLEKRCESPATTYAEKYCTALLTQARESSGAALKAEKQSSTSKGCVARVRR